MIMLEIIFFVFTVLLTAYIVRHYVFTFEVLRAARKTKFTPKSSGTLEPTVSILIPERNESKVIGSLLQRITHLAYPRE